MSANELKRCARPVMRPAEGRPRPNRLIDPSTATARFVYPVMADEPPYRQWEEDL